MKDKNYMSMQQVCILSYPKQCVHRQACGHSVRLGCQSVCVRVCVYVMEKREGWIFFLPSLFLPRSRYVSSISHPSIFHFYMQLQM